MITLDLKVINDDGIHARPSSLIVESLENLNVNVTFEKKDTTADASSVLSILLLAASKNSQIHIIINGKPSDEEKAANILKYLFSSGFKDAY